VTLRSVPSDSEKCAVLRIALILKLKGHGVAQVIADEDLERETEEKTSAVHFMRFELSTDQIAALKDGAKLFASVEHAAYPIPRFEVSQTTRDALTKDLVLTSH
jgi:uncharacterized protein (DUF1697 family)